MGSEYIWLAPIAVLAALGLFRFVGCLPDLAPLPNLDLAKAYDAAVKEDKPAGYWRFMENPIAEGVVAKDESGPPDGTYHLVSTPLPAGDPAWRSTGVTSAQLDIVAPEERLLGTSQDSSTIRIHGGFVQVPFSGPLNSPEFTLEMLVFPEWPVHDSLGSFYCVLESSSDQPPAPAPQKSLGYAIYAGPDDLGDPNSPYHWQVWVGTGSGFQRLPELKPYKHPENNSGPEVVLEPTYLALVFSAAQVLFYMYTPTRDMDHVKYELVGSGYQPNASADLFIGVSGPRRALFAPFPGPDTLLYPFWGRITEVAIYPQALAEERIIQHITSGFTTG